MAIGAEVGAPRTEQPLATRERLEQLFDRVYSASNMRQVKRAVVYLAVGGLCVHLGLVFLARHLADPHPLIAAVGTHYLAALYTPFSFVLFYEVLLLILSIPQSTTRSVGKQYEIISLIVIRNVFKDIAAFESVTEIGDQLTEVIAVLLDMGGGLLMFLLVTVFYHVNGKRPRRPVTDPAVRQQVEVFIGRKKLIALALSLVFFAFAATSLAGWALDVQRVVFEGAAPTVDVRTVFYKDLFTVMIFADAVILVLSLLLPSYYELVFRNAAFIASTMLLRLSLAVQKPYDVELALVSIAFGTLVLLVHGYFVRIALASGEGDLAGEHVGERPQNSGTCTN